MANKHKAWLHVGLPGAGDLIEPALAHHHDALVELGVASIARTTAESFRAAVEITRSHCEWGLARADVEGQWTRMVRRAARANADLVFSQPLLAGATADQVDLLVDALAGFQVHVVLTTAAGDETATLERWARAVRRPERVHVLETDGLEPEDVWRAWGRLVGFGTRSLGLDAVPRPVPACRSIQEAQRELERLARRNASLELRLEELDRKRHRLRRRHRQAA